MIIVAGGCSFVWGSELQDSPHGGPTGYSKNTFPALLSRGHQYICAAYPGLGNRAIAQRVKESVDRWAIGLVIVCWTWPTRDRAIDSDEVIVDLQRYLDDRGIPYLFTCADNCIKTDNRDIDWEDWFWFPAGCDVWTTTSPRGFYQWAAENKYPVGPEKHPLEQAHIDAAALMQGKFNELVKKTHPSYKI